MNEVYEYNQTDLICIVSDDDIISVSEKLMKRNKHIYEEFAK